MALHVVQVPDPPAGEDWSWTVPGRFFYEVTGITATLTTGNGAPSTLVDASGDGFDGTYAGVPISVPGLVPGDTATNWSGPPSATAHVPFGIIDWSSDWSVEWWAQGVQAVDAFALYAVNGPDPTFTTQLSVEINFLGAVDVNQVTSGVTIADWHTAFGAVPTPGTPNYIVITFDAFTGTIAAYVNGAAVAIFDSGFGPFSLAGLTDMYLPAAPSAGNFVGPVVEDEVAIYGAVLNAGQVAAHYAAGLVDIATYTAAVMGDGPAAYYHLDDVGATGGREPSLLLSDGTHVLEAIPPGFPAVSTPGPYQYAWQPGLNADTQSTDGTLTTVAIPPLLIPAGYVFGPRTLDLQPSDQWSNVRVQWDDSYMATADTLSPYVYPPGVTLTYQQIGT